MYPIKKMLVPTDFSENASCAYSHAQQIASRYKATVDFIHIIPTLQYFSESFEQLGMPLDMEQDVYPHAQEQAKEKMKERMESSLQKENKGKSIVRIESKPSKAIAEHAENEGYDLVVMAAKGDHASDFLRGSITGKVIRYSSVPVLTVSVPNGATFETILVPTDGSQASLEALPVAVSIALNHQASITLFHVLELHGSLTENVVKNVNKSQTENIRDVIYDAIDAFFAAEGMSAELQRETEFRSRIVPGNEDPQKTVEVHTVIEKAISAHAAITEYGNGHADLTVMATRGRSGLAHLFLGSVAEKVVQHAACPILTVKPDLTKAD